MVVPASAHAAFHNAAHYFGIGVHKVPVRDDWRAVREYLLEQRADKARDRTLRQA